MTMTKKEIITRIKTGVKEIQRLEIKWRDTIRKFKTTAYSSFMVYEFELENYGAHMDCYRDYYKVLKMSDSKLTKMKKEDLLFLFSSICDVYKLQNKKVETLIWEEEFHVGKQLERMDDKKFTEEKILIKSAARCFAQSCGNRYDLVTMIGKDDKVYICKREDYDDGVKSKEPGFAGKYIEAPRETFDLASLDYDPEDIEDYKLFERLNVAQLDLIRHKIKHLKL